LRGKKSEEEQKGQGEGRKRKRLDGVGLPLWHCEVQARGRRGENDGRGGARKGGARGTRRWRQKRARRSK